LILGHITQFYLTSDLMVILWEDGGQPGHDFGHWLAISYSTY